MLGTCRINSKNGSTKRQIRDATMQMKVFCNTGWKSTFHLTKIAHLKLLNRRFKGLPPTASAHINWLAAISVTRGGEAVPGHGTLYRKVGGEGGQIQCTACRRYCRIPKGYAGYCGVRVNDGGKLTLSVYAKPVAVWVDPVEKKPLNHFLPGTTAYSIGTLGCNFACTFCQNWDISQAPNEARQADPAKWREYFGKLVARCPTLEPKEAVANALAAGSSCIAFTYNEPTIFAEYAVDVMKLACRKGLKGVFVTNGFEGRECWDALAPHIQAANIDLKAFNDEFYSGLCKAPNALEGVKDSIEYAKKLGIWVEVTTLLIPGLNDKQAELEALAGWLVGVDANIPWHVTAFHPDYLMLNRPSTPDKTLVKAREIGWKAGLKYVYCGNTLSIPDGGTTFCPECKKPAIRREGLTVVENTLKKDGKCAGCGQKLTGVWS